MTTIRIHRAGVFLLVCAASAVLLYLLAGCSTPAPEQHDIVIHLFGDKPEPACAPASVAATGKHEASRETVALPTPSRGDFPIRPDPKQPPVNEPATMDEGNP